MRKILLSAILSLIAFTGKSQDQDGPRYLQMMNDSNANFYDIKREFENYWQDRAYTRGSGYNIFKRWAAYMEPRVYPTGNLRGVGRSRAIEELKKFNAEMASAKNGPGASVTATTAAWVPLGPFGPATNTGDGRIQCVRINPS